MFSAYGVDIRISVPKEYSGKEMIDCLIQIKKRFGNLDMTMFGCTCEIKEYINRIINIIDETDL